MTGAVKWSSKNVGIDGLPEACTGTGGHFLELPSDYSDLRPICTPLSIRVHVRWKLHLKT